ncbi:MmgE/PrpD family protein [Aeromicrobium sp. CTD01-1L150]|uniref:MmgE/PrpD family protein n=1 Tax=Aeromicrobium sp. CTD01-1L150 TaxID=3341830 RepID=UPI0035BEE3E5
MHTLTDYLARSVIAYQQATIPDDVRLIARSSILDWLGVAIAGADSESVKALHETLPTGAPSGGTVIGGLSLAHPVVAARLNGTAGHALDFDDVISPFGHPTAPVLPAALSLAESHILTGADLLRAFVAGVETECRVGEAAGPKHYERGFHSTATNGIFGATAAAAALIGLDERQTAHALGLASTSASGLKSAFGTWGKPLQVGHAASEGLLAALLAGEGGDSPAGSLECPQGYLETHTPEPGPKAGILPPGDPWAIRGMLFKYHASCYGTHSSIETLLRLRTEADGVDVDRFELGICPRHVGMCDQVNVRTPLAAKFSLGFTAALAWSKGRVGIEEFGEQMIADEDLQQLASKVKLFPSPERDFSSTEVTVRLADGRSLAGAVDTSIPASGDGLEEQWERLVDKFEALSTQHIGTANVSHVIELVGNLEQLTDIRDLTAAVAAR